jgi:hypothetical protein
VAAHALLRPRAQIRVHVIGRAARLEAERVAAEVGARLLAIIIILIIILIIDIIAAVPIRVCPAPVRAILACLILVDCPFICLFLAICCEKAASVVSLSM